MIIRLKKVIYIILCCFLLIISINYLDIIEYESNYKVISISPAATEILYEIGAGEYVIGVSSYCNFPEEVNLKKRVGSFEAPDIENIFKIGPNVVFLDSGVQINIISQLQNLGIKVIALDAKTFEDILQNIKIIGQVTYHEKDAINLCKYMNEKCFDICTKVKYCDYKPKVFFEVWDEPLMCAGSETFIYHIINMSGGENIINTDITGYSRYNIEVLINKNPEIYIINSHCHELKNVHNRMGYLNIQAIYDQKIYIIDENLISRAGPRIVNGLEIISLMLHPELYY